MEEPVLVSGLKRPGVVANVFDSRTLEAEGSRERELEAYLGSSGNSRQSR